MNTHPASKSLVRPTRTLSVIAVASLVFIACKGDQGDPGAQGPAGPGSDSETRTELARAEATPGINVSITGLSGASGAGGKFAVGDTITVAFTVEKSDGTDWDLSELGSSAILVSGPTFNYNPIIDRLGDLHTASVQQADGSYRYTFPTAIPAVYLPPANDTPSFGVDDGELQGLPLLDGTYTVGMYTSWNYTVEGTGFRDAGDATFDFLLGASATSLVPRELVKRENCNQCHSDLQFHGGLRRATTLCLLCHTAGAEDRNVASVAGGTPGETIEFGVMVHKIHNGGHLPRVLGVTTDASGARDYAATPRPYQLVGFGNNLHDYSEIELPVWPNMSSPMPRDSGYAALGSTERGLEDQMRRGVTNCATCHGDPDNAGPISAPVDGDLIYTQLKRKTCGSCHDDWVPTNPYTANTQTMPPQLNDSACTLCHAETGNNLAVRDAHLHPLKDAGFATGLNLAVADVAEGGVNDGDGTIDPGEKVVVTFTLTDDMGSDVSVSTLNAFDVGFSGPNENMNLLLYSGFPSAALSDPQPYVSALPQRRYAEYLGTATGAADSFGSNFTPHWNVSGGLTEVYERGVVAGGSSTLAAATGPAFNYIDVADATGFDRDDWIVIEDGSARREFLRIQWVDGTRLWFSSPYSAAYAPGPQTTHDVGDSVIEVSLTQLTEGVEYTLVEATGVVDESGGFTTGADIVVSYTADFVMPANYSLAVNQGTDLGEAAGSWVDLPIESGTYSLTLWGSIPRTLSLFGESNSYREVSPGFLTDVLVGDETVADPYDKISSADNCYACHADIDFHGGRRRGYETCVICHGTAGSGDRPRYVAANAPATDGVTINFRSMLHKIHHGAELANASTYEVIGFGTGYPDNFSPHSYEDVTFPAFPAGTQACATCHGDGNTAWISPDARMHSGGQVTPTLAWTTACGSCHDSGSELAHMDAQTGSSGVESCSVCHDPGKFAAVEVVHTPR